jgi:hypothetical protein
MYSVNQRQERTERRTRAWCTVLRLCGTCFTVLLGRRLGCSDQLGTVAAMTMLEGHLTHVLEVVVILAMHACTWMVDAPSVGRSRQVE